jgi:ADP-sugar diphosphatase
MSTFTIPFASSSVAVIVPDHLSVTQHQLNQFAPFRSWVDSLEKSIKNTPGTFSLRSIDIQSVDIFSKNKIGFVKLKANLIHPNGRPLPGIVMLRGGTVSILVVLEASDSPGDRYLVLVQQPRVAVAEMALVEIPAGMLDDGTFKGASAKELEEECGITVQENELLELNPVHDVLVSPGMTDEHMRFFLYEKKMSLADIRQLDGKLGGLSLQHGEENEVITVKLVKFDQALDLCRDGKLLMALCLYERYQRSAKHGTD